MELDSMLKPEVILASNTSSISITKLAAQTQRPGHVIGMHFFNPVPVMSWWRWCAGWRPAMNLCDGPRTGRVLGKTPVEVNDAPGFVSNRVLMPLINEAIFAVMEGVATPEAVDEVFKLGMAHPMGPLTLADFIGLDVCLDIMRVLHGGPRRSQIPPLPAADPDGGCGLAGAQVGARVLPILNARGIAAGTCGITSIFTKARQRMLFA